MTIFGDNRNNGEIVGFGADQVILVRDDCAKKEICKYVGSNALVLTIVECKGLEFQDVLLYNFFGTSPLKDRWRVIFEYMKKYDWLDKELPQSFPAFDEARHSVLCSEMKQLVASSPQEWRERGKKVNISSIIGLVFLSLVLLLDEKLPQSFPTFSEERHSVLCSELKQLYVAITRTRQRLWICENKEELSNPMFDYWKLRGLVQMRKLDDSMARTMRVASSPREWRERGKKNFVMAMLCFERAGDTMWVKMAKAYNLRASADQMRGTNHEAFLGYAREAAEMFESIGKHESAASCYCDLGEYERAGNIYLHTCGKVDTAAECFSLAGCYSEVAEAYAKGDQFSNCLLVCKEEKLFDKDLGYIKYWKESVKEFYSMESKRVFLKSLGFLGDLLLLEEESGQFLEAAELEMSLDDVIKEADLLEKVGHFKEAAVLLLWYVYFSSLWGNGNTGWPLKQFSQKEVLCEKAKLLAKMELDVFCDFVCSELKVLCDNYNSLCELKNDLDVSRKSRSLRGEILLIRKILDAHFRLNSSKYEWEDELPFNLYKHSKDKMLQNRVSIRTLVFYWNAWKENVV
ncbi:uvrD-like Helicase, ATP-binding domain, P-loop containing nucleoside triphosphate hydrolase [Artemisia annua]|uniref:UvrD-like Helicase, ATP-binding domain, P-loop containing nucleoside triphosphate hydrolase n=1 Tax=Artemisia annua TaxID=35608 RepID=A0A2U1MCW4_ARTAN|nr:uvrD-like Helicase, ATP-binding domain, P-loop containing nucleoside triphosphate hydrolase [Artemisia annua]